MTKEWKHSHGTVSVVIPTYNRGHLLERTIPSYVQQGVCEIIMVDDGSSDNTEDVVHSVQRHYPLVRYTSMHQNSGQCAALNEGIRLATGEYIYFGDDDTILLKDSIPNLLESLRRNEADIVGARAVYMNAGESMEESLRRTQHNPGYVADIEHLRFAFNSDPGDDVEVPCVPACALMSTELARETMFDPSYIGNGLRQETDFQLRAAEQRNAVVYFCPQAVAVNLPREEASGGAWSMGWLKYERYALRNNWMFLNRHYAFLRHRWGVTRSKLTMQMAFILRERLEFVVRNLIKGIIGNRNVERIRRRRVDKV